MTLTTFRPDAFVLLAMAACTPAIAPGPVPSPSADPPGGCGETMSCDPAPTPDTTLATDPPTPAPRSIAPRPTVERSPEPAPYPYRVRIVDDESRDLPRFWQDGRSYVLGTRGARYAVVISNPTPYRVEAVLSIDGLDAIDGGPADYVRKDGYIVPAYGNATIEGFRTSLDRVATFRFSSVADSYAGRLGQARNVGVIGVAFFPERPRTPVVMAPAPKPAEPMRAAGDGSGAMSPPPSARAQPKSAAAGEASSEFDVRENKRPGLGTEFGEARDSRVEEVEFARANRTTPAQVTTVRYNDRAGLLALGIRVDPVSGTELRTRETAEAFRANRFAAPPP